MPELHDAFAANSRAFRDEPMFSENDPRHCFLKRRIRRRWRAAEMQRHFVSELKTLAEGLPARCAQSGIHLPLLLVLLPADKEPVSVDIPSKRPGDADSLEAASRAMSELAREHNAVALAIVRPRWLRPGSPRRLPFFDEPGEPRAGLYEALSIQLIRSNAVETFIAPILRFEGQPPTVGSWEKASCAEPGAESPYIADTGPMIRANHLRYVS